MSKRTPTRLTRLLSLVSYLSDAGAVTIKDLAEHFGVTPEQISADINTLWVSGTPGYLADDLIDFDYESYASGTIELTAHRGLNQTLRLGAREAMSLVASLNALRELVGSVSQSDQNLTMVTKLIDQLSEFLGHSANALDVKLTLQGAPTVLQNIHQAISSKVSVEIDYVTADDRRSVRTIEPFHVVNDADQFYVVAFCQSAQQERVFRLDRIIKAEVLTHLPMTHEPPAQETPVVPRATEVVTLELLPGSQWLAEHLPNQGQTHNQDGSITLKLEIANPQWLETIILQYAPLVKAVTPDTASSQAATRARATLDLYAHFGLLGSS